MVKSLVFFKSSERKTCPLTPTDVEREAASEDRKRDGERVHRDLRAGADKHLTARMFSAHSCIAHYQWHDFLFVSATHLGHYIFWQDGDRTPLFGRAIENPLVRLPHCATAHSHISLVSDSHKENANDLDRVKRFSPLLGNKLHIALNIKIDLRKCITQT